MDVNVFVRSISGFVDLKFTDQIKLFAWFLLKYQKKELFLASDISDCYRRCNISPPSSVAPFLSSLVDRKDPIFLRKSGGYVLEYRISNEYDQKYGKRDTEIHVDKLLSELPNKLPNQFERVYLEEALICFRHQAFRASIVMTWNLAFDHLCNHVLSMHLPEFNTQLPKTFPKAEIIAIRNRDDFSALKEFQVLQVCSSANIVSGGVFTILKEKLRKRNDAAHPSGIVIKPPTAEEFITDLVENVVLKIN